MTTPLDQHEVNRTGAIRAARIFSNIVSPPIMFALLGLTLALQARPFPEGLLWAAGYGFFVSLAPILVVLYLLKTGHIHELHMSNTRERHIPYASAVFWALLALGIFTLFDGPPIMRSLLIFNAVELAALGIINVWWLISIHATGIMATFLIVGLVFGWGWSLIVVPFIFAVCGVRLYLKRHSPSQIIAGLGLGVLSVWVLTLFGSFI